MITAKRRSSMSIRCRHESGPAQLEINFNHGDPLELADQVFLFKRTVRQAALKHDMYATFMAKPHENEPGSSMHIHQSVMDVKTGKNIFAGQGRQALQAVPRITLPACSAISRPLCRSPRPM